MTRLIICNAFSNALDVAETLTFSVGGRRMGAWGKAYGDTRMRVRHNGYGAKRMGDIWGRHMGQAYGARHTYGGSVWGMGLGMRRYVPVPACGRW